MASRVESRTVTFAVKRTIRFREEFAFSVRADGRKCKQPFTLADDEETLVTIITVNPVGSVVADWPGIDRMGLFGIAAIIRHLATGSQSCRQQ